jgi:hypothetical protein
MSKTWSLKPADQARSSEQWLPHLTIQSQENDSELAGCLKIKRLPGDLLLETLKLQLQLENSQFYNLIHFGLFSH